jgi:hypothetical protein
MEMVDVKMGTVPSVDAMTDYAACALEGHLQLGWHQQLLYLGLRSNWWQLSSHFGNDLNDYLNDYIDN